MRPTIANRIASCVLATLVFLLAPCSFGDSTRFGLNTDLSYDSNFTRGSAAADQKADWALSVEGYLAKSSMLGERSGLVLRAGARYTQLKDFKDVSNLALSGRAAYRVQPGSGYSAPWLEVAGDLRWLNHSDSALRDGWIGSLSASVGSHVTDRLRATLGGGLLERKSDHPVFTLSNAQIWATVDYRTGIRNTLYGRITYETGDQVFSANDPATQARLIPASKVYDFDPALGTVVYRMEGKSQFYDFGFNFPLKGNHALDLFARWYSSKSDYYGDKYDGYLLQLAYLFRFQ